MHRVFLALGWILILGGLVGGVLSYFIISGQDFVLALLARVVERPFEYRTYVALLASVAVLLTGGLVGGIYVGIAQILQRGRGGAA